MQKKFLSVDDVEERNYLLSSRKMASERQGNSVNVTQRDLLRPSIPSGTIVGFVESVMEVLLVDDEDHGIL